MIFVIDLIILLAPYLLAAASSSQLTCNSTQLANGSVEFQLSQGPSSSSCETSWEDHNKTVIARNKTFNPDLVQRLRNDSITLTDCRHLRYNLECFGVLREINCPVNCSHHVDPDPLSHPPNSIAQDKPATIILTSVAAAALLVIFVAVLWCRRSWRNPRHDNEQDGSGAADQTRRPSAGWIPFRSLQCGCGSRGNDHPT